MKREELTERADVRCAPSEKERWKRAAKHAGESLSDLARRLLNIESARVEAHVAGAATEGKTKTKAEAGEGRKRGRAGAGAKAGGKGRGAR